MKLPERDYSDILHAVRPESRRKKMSPLARAAQFAPFAALSGFEDSIEETARLTDVCPELTLEETLAINRQLCELLPLLPERPEVTFLCFEPDEKKPGGAYRSITGRVRRIDEAGQCVLLADGRSIPFGRIHGMEKER